MLDFPCEDGGDAGGDIPGVWGGCKSLRWNVEREQGQQARDQQNAERRKDIKRQTAAGVFLFRGCLPIVLFTGASTGPGWVPLHRV